MDGISLPHGRLRTLAALTKPKFHHKMALTFQNNREQERNEYANTIDKYIKS